MRAPYVVQSMGFDRWMGSRTHRYSIIQNSFTALKILRLHLLTPLPTSPWQPLIFLLSLVLTFSESHRVGGTQLIAFSDWLLSPRGGGCLVAESCPTLCNPMDCSFSADGISQERILNRLPFPSPGDLPEPEIEPPVSCISRQILYH